MGTTQPLIEVASAERNGTRQASDCRVGAVDSKLGFAQTILSHLSIERGEMNTQHICRLEHRLAAL